MTYLDMHGYRRLTPEQRALVDEWLDQCDIERASRIRRCPWGTLVLVRLMNGDGQWYGRWLPIRDPPFPWDAVLHRGGTTDPEDAGTGPAH